MNHCLHQTNKSNFNYTRFEEICCNCGKTFTRTAVYDYNAKLSNNNGHGSYLPNSTYISVIVDREGDGECK